MHFIIGSTSELKIGVVKQVFEEYLGSPFTITSLNIDSGVSDTPFECDMFKGAKNRASVGKKIPPDTVGLGIESGLILKCGILFEEAVAVLYDGDKLYYGVSSSYQLPDSIKQAMDEGKYTHPQLMDKLDKNNHGKDTWANYSEGRISRQTSIYEAVRNCILSFSSNNNITL